MIGHQLYYSNRVLVQGMMVMTVLAMLTACRQTLIWITLIYKPTPPHTDTVFATPRAGACCSLMSLVPETASRVPVLYLSYKFIVSTRKQCIYQSWLYWVQETACHKRNHGLTNWNSHRIVIRSEHGDWPNIFLSGGWKSQLVCVSVRLRPWSPCQQCSVSVS